METKRTEGGGAYVTVACASCNSHALLRSGETGEAFCSYCQPYADAALAFVAAFPHWTEDHDVDLLTLRKALRQWHELAAEELLEDVVYHVNSGHHGDMFNRCVSRAQEEARRPARQNDTGAASSGKAGPPGPGEGNGAQNDGGPSRGAVGAFKPIWDDSPWCPPARPYRFPPEETP